MNGFLVVLRHSMDDIPLLLTDNEDEAMRFAESVNDSDGKTEKQVLSLDSSTPVCVCVWIFVSGHLVGSRLVKSFE